MKPPVSVLDARFVYTPSHATDVAATFKRIRAERKKASELARKETEANQASVQRIFQLRREGKS